MSPVVREYQLVNFLDETGEDGLRSVECVPSSWVSFDSASGSCMVRYMQPPYEDEDRQLIRDLIRKKADPPESWPLFRVSLQGHAKTHAEGLQRVKKLSKHEYAYTTEAENDGEKKAKSVMELLKKQKAQHDKFIGNVLSRRTLSSESQDDDENNNADYPKDESSSESERVCIKRRQNLKMRTSKNVFEKESSVQISTSKAGKNIDKNSVEQKKKPTSNDTATNSVQQTPMNRQAEQNNDNNHIFASEDAKLLYRTMMKVSAVLKLQTEEIQALRHAFERSLKVTGNGITTNFFAEKYSFSKIKTEGDFRAFDARLKNEEEFRNDFHAALNCIAESDVKKTINAILKKYFTQAFVMECTAVKESKIKGQKLILKGTKFYDCVFDFVRKLHSAEQNVTEKVYYRSLAAGINNAKDWDGGRKLRAPQTNKKN